jgi:hypothetical protein
MATACWAFIVAKSPPPKTAPLLDFGSLHGTNIENHQHVIHKWLWTGGGYFQRSLIVVSNISKDNVGGSNSHAAPDQWNTCELK